MGADELMYPLLSQNVPLPNLFPRSRSRAPSSYCAETADIPNCSTSSDHLYYTLYYSLSHDRSILPPETTVFANLCVCTGGLRGNTGYNPVPASAVDHVEATACHEFEHSDDVYSNTRQLRVCS